MCSSQNGAGSAQKSFSVTVAAQHHKGKVTAAAASSESHYVNDSEDTKLQGISLLPNVISYSIIINDYYSSIRGRN